MRKDTFYNMASDDNTIGTLSTSNITRGTLFNGSAYTAIYQKEVE